MSVPFTVRPFASTVAKMSGRVTAPPVPPPGAARSTCAKRVKVEDSMKNSSRRKITSINEVSDRRRLRGAAKSMRIGHLFVAPRLDLLERRTGTAARLLKQHG